MYNIDTPMETILRNKNIKAIFFDMDGILFNSMPYHAEAWHKALLHFGLEFSPYEAYLHEGRTADSTIDAIYNRLYGHDADRTTKDEIINIRWVSCTKAYRRHSRSITVGQTAKHLFTCRYRFSSGIAFREIARVFPRHIRKESYRICLRSKTRQTSSRALSDGSQDSRCRRRRGVGHRKRSSWHTFGESGRNIHNRRKYRHIDSRRP